LASQKIHPRQHRERGGGDFPSPSFQKSRTIFIGKNFFPAVRRRKRPVKRYLRFRIFANGGKNGFTAGGKARFRQIRRQGHFYFFGVSPARNNPRRRKNINYLFRHKKISPFRKFNVSIITKKFRSANLMAQFLIFNE